jgi:hypothetical protein
MGKALRCALGLALLAGSLHAAAFRADPWLYIRQMFGPLPQMMMPVVAGRAYATLTAVQNLGSALNGTCTSGSTVTCSVTPSATGLGNLGIYIVQQGLASAPSVTAPTVCGSWSTYVLYPYASSTVITAFVNFALTSGCTGPINAPVTTASGRGSVYLEFAASYNNTGFLFAASGGATASICSSGACGGVTLTLGAGSYVIVQVAANNSTVGTGIASPYAGFLTYRSGSSTSAYSLNTTSGAAPIWTGEANSGTWTQGAIAITAPR